MIRQFLIFPLLAAVSVSLSGCLMTSQKMGDAAIPFEKQQQDILAIAPLGTSRDEAVRRLSVAGIDGSYGASQSVYYCNVWKRQAGGSEILRAALLFDETGKLYDVRSGQSETGVYGDAGLRNAAATLTAAEQASSATPAAMTSATSPSADAGSSRNGRRGPFAAAESLPDR